MDAALENAYRGHHHRFEAVAITLPDGVIRLTSGGDVVIGGHLYEGFHPQFGTVAALSSVRDGVQGEASTMDVTLMPPDAEALAAFLNIRRRQISVYKGAVNPETGAPFGVETLFEGRVQEAPLIIRDNGWELNLLVAGAGVAQRRSMRGRTLSHAHHISVWGAANEQGLVNVTGVTAPVYWRTKGPTPTRAPAAPPFGGGGGGGYFQMPSISF